MIYMIMFFIEMSSIGIWMSGVQAWVMVPCMHSLSHSPCTMQRIDMVNANNTLKHGLRNPNERYALELTSISKSCLRIIL